MFQILVDFRVGYCDQIASIRWIAPMLHNSWSDVSLSVRAAGCYPYVDTNCDVGHQLYGLGLLDHNDVDFDSRLGQLLMDMYQRMGNQLALQYGGSHLAHTMKTYSKKSWATQGRDLLESVKRYYTNSFMDRERQGTM